MSGLRKAKKYDWKDSNMALFGSDTEKQVKKESAESEPAWQGCGQEAGLKIWRIVKFEVQDWPQEDYGKFYSGDSYIILNTYKPDPDSEELAYDVHFWIGQYSTQDEYGTAAYKTVEVDTFLDDRAVQHREVQGHESSVFLSYFDQIQYMDGGADTGFRHVEPEEYQTRLMVFSKVGRQIRVKEVPLSRSRVTTNDVFILDQGLQIYQWNGTECSKDEKFKAAQFLQTVKSERGGKPTVDILEEDDISPSHPFYEALTEEDTDEEADELDAPSDNKLFKISDESGSMEFSLVGEGSVADQLVSDDVFILDSGNSCFVWVGNAASVNEKKNGMAYASEYLMKNAKPLLPITVLKEGQENKEFQTALAA